MMRYHRLTTALAAGLLTLLCACNAGTSAQPSPSPSSSPAAPSPTPTVSGSSEDTPASGGGVLSSFTAQDLNGNQVDQSVLADYQLTMVNIWATFCGPCLSEMPELGEIHAEYADKGVQVVGIVADVLNQDGSFNEDYCKWCYADGKYVYNDLGELIDYLVGHLSNENWPADKARGFFENELPQLKYWKEKSGRG